MIDARPEDHLMKIVTISELDQLYSTRRELSMKHSPEAFVAFKAVEDALQDYTMAANGVTRNQLANDLGADIPLPDVDALRQVVIDTAHALPPLDAIMAAHALRKMK
jgi:hypothetical protein